MGIIGRFHGFPDALSVMASVGGQDARCGRFVGHHQIEAEMFRGPAGRTIGSHGQPGRVDAEMDLVVNRSAHGRDPVAESPFAPAA